MSPVPKMSSLTVLNSRSPQWQQYERTHTHRSHVLSTAQYLLTESCVGADWSVGGRSRDLWLRLHLMAPQSCLASFVCAFLCICVCESSCIIDVPLPPPRLGERPPDSGLLTAASVLLFISSSSELRSFYFTQHLIFNPLSQSDRSSV